MGQKIVNAYGLFPTLSDAMVCDVGERFIFFSFFSSRSNLHTLAVVSISCSNRCKDQYRSVHPIQPVSFVSPDEVLCEINMNCLSIDHRFNKLCFTVHLEN